MAIQQHFADNTIAQQFTQAPVRVITKPNTIKQVLLVLDGRKESERMISHALTVAREQNAELVLVYTCKQSTLTHAELYLKTLSNKIRAQYNQVTAFLHRGMDAIQALDFAIGDDAHTYVIFPTPKISGLQRILRANPARQLKKLYPALTVQQVTI